MQRFPVLISRSLTLGLPAAACRGRGAEHTARRHFLPQLHLSPARDSKLSCLFQSSRTAARIFAGLE